MAIVQVFTAERMLEIENTTVVSGSVNEDGDLILITRDGTEINAGYVQAPNLADASETVRGIVELATSAEVVAGTDTERATTPAGVKAAIDNIPSASTTTEGVVELATVAETLAGTDADKAITAAGLLAALARGSNNKVVNGDFRLNLPQYVSGAPLIPGSKSGRGHSLWHAVGNTNLAQNGRYGSAGTTTTGYTLAQNGSTFSESGSSTGGPITNAPSYHRYTFSTAGSAGKSVEYGSLAITPAIPWCTYKASIYVRASQALTGVYLDLIARSSAGTALVDGTQTPVTLVANAWTKLTADSIVADPQTAYVTARVMIPNAITAGLTLDISALIIFEGLTTLPDYFDGASTGCSWVSTAFASASVDRSAVPSYTFTEAKHGQTITLADGTAIKQVLDRANFPTAPDTPRVTFGHDGTALIRVYRASDTPPAFQAAPFVFTQSSPEDDVVIEFEATAGGGTKTVSRVRGYTGSTDFPYEPRLIAQELDIVTRKVPVSFYARGVTTYAKSGAASYSLLPFLAVGRDSGFCYDTATSRFTAPVDGEYHFEASAVQTGTVGGPALAFYKNGVFHGNGLNYGATEDAILYGVAYNGATASINIPLVAGDYVQVYQRNNNDVSQTIDGSRSKFLGYLVR